MFNQSYSAQVFRIGQRVLVDGVFRPDVVCMSVSTAAGAEGTSASLQVPSSDWDHNALSWKGRFIQVYIFAGGTTHQPFAGWVTNVPTSTGSRMIELEARSALALSDRVIVGGGMGSVTVEYPREARNPSGDIEETGWDVRAIVADVLSGQAATWRGGGGGLAGPWRSRIALGNTSALRASINTRAYLGDIVARQMSFRALLDELIAKLATVSIRERFLGQVSYLDWFELGRGFGRKDLVLARTGQPAAGSWVLNASHSISDEAQVGGIRAFGGFDRRVSSVYWDPASAGSNDLTPLWESALEPFVLADPGLATGESGSPSAALEVMTERPATTPEELQKVFRRFRLPESLDKYEVSEELRVRFDDGGEAKAWAFVEDSILAQLTEGPFPPDPGAPVPHPALPITPGVGDFAADGTRVEKIGFKLLPGRVIEFDKPLTRVAWQAVDSEGASFTRYVRASGAVTLAFLAGRLEATAGNLLNPPEAVIVVINDSFGRVQVRPSGAEWPSKPTLVLGPSGAEAFTTATDLQDDRRALRDFTAAGFRERQRPTHEYQIGIPWYTSGVLVGDSVYLVGQADADRGPHVVMAVSWNTTNEHETSISTSNSLPIVASTILESGE